MNNSSLRVAFLLTTDCLVAGLIFCAGCTSTTGPAQQKTGNLYGFDDFVTRKMAAYEVPGAVVGIVEDDQVGYLTYRTSPSGAVTGFDSKEIGPFSRAWVERPVTSRRAGLSWGG